jgi:sugar/nucleoside kinase (ribokinase family)
MKFPFPIPNDRAFDVVGFGTNAVDYLIRLPKFPEFDSKIEISEYAIAPGGEVASTLVGLSRLGMKTSYAGRFGGDEAGRIGINSLIDEGVDVSHAEVVEAAQTQVAFILVDEESGERTVLWQRDARLAYTADDAPAGIARQGRVLHLTPHDGEACIIMANAAREAGTIVSADIDNVFPKLEELLPLIDVCIVSGEFAERFTSEPEPRGAIRRINERFRNPIVGLTRGEAGSLLFVNGGFIESLAYPAPGGCVDTTGAGDAFRSGLLYGLLAGLSVEDAAAAANGVAALKCRGPGARTSLPRKPELNALIGKRENHPR